MNLPPAPSAADYAANASASAPGVRCRPWRALRRWLVAGLVAVYFLAGLSFLLVRDVVLPRVDYFRGDIGTALGDALGLPVSIDGLWADVSGLRPRLRLSGLQLRDREGRPALRLDAVDATLAWSSLLRGQIHFHRLILKAPDLALRRDADGRIFIAGIPIDTVAADTSAGGLSDWLLGQREIIVRDAAFTWNDARRAAPELRLEHVDFRLVQAGGRYRFGLHGGPPAALAAALDLRGDVSSATPGEPRTWTGKLYLALDRATLGGWRAWIDYPFEIDGRGGLRAWLGLTNGQPDALAGDLILDDVTARFAAALPELALRSVHGSFSGRRTASGRTLSTRALEFATDDGVRIAPTDIDLALRSAPGDPSAGGELSANRFDLAMLARLAAHLPWDEALRAKLAAFDPRGHLEDLRFGWRGKLADPRAWTLKARFHDFALNPQDVLPGVAGLSGEIDGSDRQGRFHLAGRDMALDLPAIFPQPRLALSTLQVDGGWAHPDDRMEITLDKAAFDNADAAGNASGRYRPSPAGRGEIDLAAHLTRARTEAVWRYLPKVIDDDTRGWLRRSLHGGTVPGARLRLQGNLDDFPFPAGVPGQFLVTTRVAGARLDYATDWPAITDIYGELRFEGPAMRIVADRARIVGTTLTDVVAEIPELNAPRGEVMSIRGRASGPTAAFLRFVSESPVRERIDGFTDAMRAEGNGKLDLKLVMPLHDIDNSTVKGDFRFAANRLWLVEALPPVDDAAGSVSFTEKDLAIPDARGRLFGEPMQLTAGAAKGGGVSFDAAGAASIRALRQTWDWPLFAHVSGTLPWHAAIEVGPQGTGVTVKSDLSGVASSLPVPMNKSATVRWPLNVALDFPRGGMQEEIRVGLEGRADLQLMRRRRGQQWEIERGGLALSAPLRLADRGVMVVGQFDALDVDAWRRAIDPLEAGNETGAADAAEPQLPPLAGIDLRARRLTAFGQTLTDMKLGAQADAGGWKGRLASAEIDGDFDWRTQGDGALRARLKRLVIGAEEEDATAPDDAAAEPPRRLPGLDVTAQRFVLRGVELGTLELQARNRGDTWHLDTLAIANPDGRLGGSGRWRPGPQPLTELDFRLEADDIGRFAVRMGYGDVVRGGHALLSGQLGWSGAPTRIDYPSLAGAMELEARDGQFRKLQPGMGRLLGVLSLQALPRRLTLDFRDVLSEGFAFDRISGSIAVSAGVMHTDDLSIRGPAARILMTGSADLEQETQDLKVTVQPTLSESVAIGTAAGLINPLAGVVAYVAQKALKDPIEKLFAFDYAITGSWTDPKVVKLGGRAPAVNTESSHGK